MTRPTAPRATSQPARAPRAIALRPRSTAALAVVAVIGLIAFAWPLIVSPGAVVGQEGHAPLLFALLLPLLLAVVLFEIAEGGIDVKAVAMLGVLSAVGAALRPLGAGTAGLETVFFLLILGGRVFGPAFGFVLGATTLFGSALATAGVGPWLPYQMLGAAFVGLGAGLLPRATGRAEVALLAAYGGVAGLLYGVALNFSFWPFAAGLDGALSFAPGAPPLDNLVRFARFSLATSLWWDLGRAFTNVALVCVTGRAVLATLRRASHRAAFGADPEFDDADDADDAHEGEQTGGLLGTDAGPPRHTVHS